AALGARARRGPADRCRVPDPADELRLLQRSNENFRLMSFLRWAQLAAALASLAMAVVVHAAITPFVVRNFRVEGAQRIAEGTIYNYLPINIGDNVDEQRIREAIRALFQTGFFQDVEVRKDGDTLVIFVLERPTIAEFKFKGNKDIKDDDLKKSLTNIGL